MIREDCFHEMFGNSNPRKLCASKIWTYTVVYSGWFTVLIHGILHEFFFLVQSFLVPLLISKKIPFLCAGRLSFGCPILDKALGHGVLVPGVTELAGTSGAGKTQFGLQLCLTVQLPTGKGGLGGGAVYVATEDAVPAKRLREMAESFSKKQSDMKYNTKQLTDAIFIEHSATIVSLFHCRLFIPQCPLSCPI